MQQRKNILTQNAQKFNMNISRFQEAHQKISKISGRRTAKPDKCQAPLSGYEILEHRCYPCSGKMKRNKASGNNDQMKLALSFWNYCETEA